MMARFPECIGPCALRGAQSRAWLISVLAISLGGVAWAEESEVSFAYVPAPDVEQVTIEQPLGRLDLHGWDEPKVRIVAKKHAPDARTLDRLRVQVDMKDGHIRIRTGTRVGDVIRPLPSSGAGGPGIDLVIDAPRTVQLRASTFWGDIEASGFRRGAELASSGGEVRASDISGSVRSTALKGRQYLSSIHGNVEAEGVSGDLELDAVEGEVLSARLVEGIITARRVQTPVVQLVSAAGGILFIGVLRKGGRYQFFANEGDVRLEFPRTPFSLSAQASGEVRCEFSLDRGAQSQPGSVHGRYLGGGPSLELSAGHGSIALVPANFSQ
jgi:hypothetical protein